MTACDRRREFRKGRIFIKIAVIGDKSDFISRSITGIQRGVLINIYAPVSGADEVLILVIPTRKGHVIVFGSCRIIPTDKLIPVIFIV